MPSPSLLPRARLIFHLTDSRMCLDERRVGTFCLSHDTAFLALSMFTPTNVLTLYYLPHPTPPPPPRSIDRHRVRPALVSSYFDRLTNTQCTQDRLVFTQRHTRSITYLDCDILCYNWNCSEFTTRLINIQ